MCSSRISCTKWLCGGVSGKSRRANFRQWCCLKRQLQFSIASSPNRRKVVTWCMDRHEHFHFSVTIQSEELFMVSAMRRLAWQCQPQINRRIAAAGTGNDQWKRNQGRATFYFTSTANRTEFLGELSRIFPTGWEKISHDEKRMAPRQN